MHVIHLDGSVAFGIVSHNILTREIRKQVQMKLTDHTKRLVQLNRRVQRTGEHQVPTLIPLLRSFTQTPRAQI